MDPYSVSSASGEWVLRVVPSEAEGGGSGHYTMRRGGEVVWEGEREHTLRECVVSDGGMVVGYAYDNGYMGWDGNLVVLSIGADGEVIESDKLERAGSGFPENPPQPHSPRGAGVMLDEVSGRGVVRITEDFQHAPRWLLYSLSTGRRIGELKPLPPVRGEWSFARQIEVRVIPGTGLTIVHWVAYEGGVPEGVFEIIDRDGRVVWTRRIGDEYAGMPEHWSWWDLVERGVRQVEVEDGGFAIVSYADGKRTRYRLPNGDAGPYIVEEAGEEDAVPMAHAPGMRAPEPRAGALVPVGEVQLGVPDDTGVINQIGSLGFDGRGRIGWVRGAHDPDLGARFTMVDRAGEMVCDIPIDLPKVERGSRPMALWLDGDRWLIARTVHGGDAATQGQAWFLDTATGEMRAVPEFKSGVIENVCRLPDGGFVVLAALHERYTITDQIQKYSPEGRMLSERTDLGDEQGLSLEDIAVLSEGTLATVCVIEGVVRLWRDGANAPEVWDLGEMIGGAQGTEGGYFSGIRADRDGGIVVLDSADNNALHRIDREGKLWQSMQVRGPRNEPFGIYGEFAVDPDGRIWASDGSRLYRCDETGRADLALGGPPEGTMGTPVAMAMGDDGSVYVVEDGTAAVHVFDAAGERIRVMEPEPGVMPTQAALAWIVVDGDGGVRYRMSYAGPIVSFDTEGKQISAQSRGAHWGHPREPLTRIGHGWEREMGVVRRVDENGNEIQRIAHRPDGGWLVFVKHAAAGPDGSLALLCSRSTAGVSGERHSLVWLCLYGPDGEGIATYCTPDRGWESRVAFSADGEQLYIIDERGLTVFGMPLDPTVAPVRYDLPKNEREAWWTIMPRPDGTLATWQHRTRVVQTWRISR
ncbi:MAG: hypothetical protein ACTS3F_09225 [Phycisphaerales bacterium]